ncbi:serine/threonine-protein phosphatase 7 long form homolog [Arachis duranensis]|uniref:Serine/threonine-protein phosphatase 7 long form homolog n=1 Tax=Arachis duranensis TaxID=130453 RepID=A0A6P4DSE0_ARADU|nr:serine/threonine-protein phosphatase 7 long form homolog [Arachis duranensis]
MVRDYANPAEHVTNYLRQPNVANRNLLPRKLDPPELWHPAVDQALRTTGFYHVSRVGQIRGHSALLSALVERWRPETHTFVLPVGEVTVTQEDVLHIFGLPIEGEVVTGWTDSSQDFLVNHSMAIFGSEPVVSSSSKSYIKLAWVRHIRDTQPLDTSESVQRYVRCHIFCLLGTTLFADKSTTYAHAKYLPLLQNFEHISTYSWGSATLAHLYRSLCRASRYDCKEMDGPLDLLFVWAWERMPFLAPIPRQQLALADIPVARRWSHHPRTRAWISKSVASIRHDIDFKEDFVWRPYLGIIIPAELHHHLDVCDTVGPLISFECVEWHPVDRVVRQYGYAQSPPLPAQAIPLDHHCYTLRGVQCHDWSTILNEWIQQWGNRRNSRLRDRNLQPIVDFIPSAEYRSWYGGLFWMYLRLSKLIQQPPYYPPQQPSHFPPQQPPQQPYAVFQSFPYHRPLLPQPSQQSPQPPHYPPQQPPHFPPQQPYAVFQPFPYHRPLLPQPSQQLPQSHRASVDRSARQSHRTPTPDSRASGSIDPHVGINTGRMNVIAAAPSGLDLNAPTQQEVVAEYIPGPSAPAKAGGSGPVEG